MEEDWILYTTGGMAQRVLQGQTFVYRKFKARSINDHEHCLFCMACIAEEGSGDYTHGYAREDLEWWVCEQCFADFKDMFDFKLKE